MDVPINLCINIRRVISKSRRIPILPPGYGSHLIRRKKGGDNEDDSVLIFTIGEQVLDNKIVLGKKFDEEKYQKRPALTIG